VSPLQGEKPQNQPVSNLNTGTLRALRAMLPVKNMDARYGSQADLNVRRVPDSSTSTDGSRRMLSITS